MLHFMDLLHRGVPGAPMAHPGMSHLLAQHLAGVVEDAFQPRHCWIPVMLLLLLPAVFQVVGR